MTVPPNHLTRTLVFHITHVENLPAIFQQGALLSTNSLSGENRVSIANEEVQNRRTRKQVSVAPEGVLHDYVPFYFAPRSPMLYCNHCQSIENAQPQSEIVTLATTAQHLANEHQCVFYDRHAVLGHAKCSNQIEELAEIDWRIFFETPLMGGYAKYWQDRQDDAHPHWHSRREVRMAEFLVYQLVDINLIQLIATQNQETGSKVEAALQESGLDITVKVKPEWYF